MLATTGAGLFIATVYPSPPLREWVTSTARSDTRELIAGAVRALEDIYRPGFNEVKAGVTLVDLRPTGQAQGELNMLGDAPAAPRRAARPIA